MMWKLAVLSLSHTLAVAGGFALGIYMLPILIAPEAPETNDVMDIAAEAIYSGRFVRNLVDSDALHWGEGDIAVTPEHVVFMGSLAPGPDYRLYLSPEFIETEADFKRLKSNMLQVGPVKTFENFIVELPAEVDLERYDSVIIWCERFGQFITAARFR